MERFVIAVAIAAGFGCASLPAGPSSNVGDPQATQDSIKEPKVCSGPDAGDEEDGLGEPSKAVGSGAVEGVVKDAKGQSLDGALVTLNRGPASLREEWEGERHFQFAGTFVTGSDGRFRFGQLPAGTYSVIVAKEGFIPEGTNTPRIQGKENHFVELTLATGGKVLSGQVRVRRGGPLVGAKVRVRLLEFGGFLGQPPVIQLTTDPAGQYRVSLGKGPIHVSVKTKGFAMFPETLMVNRSMVRNWQLSPTAQVCGRVLAREGKRPIEGATVYFHRQLASWKPPFIARSTQKGLFNLSGIEPGAYVVTAQQGDDVSLGNRVWLSPSQSLAGLEVVLDRGFSISGRVTGHVAEKMGEAGVHLRSKSRNFRLSAWSDVQSDGTFRFQGLPPGHYEISAVTGDHRLAGVSARLVAEDVRNLHLILPELIEIKGGIWTADGQPAKGAKIKAQVKIRGGNGYATRSTELVETASDGTFKFGNLVPGLVTLEVTHHELGYAVWGPEELSANQHRVPRIVLGKWATLSGKVKSASGIPVPDAEVLANMFDWPQSIRYLDVCDKNGDYQIRLPPGRGYVEAALPYHAAQGEKRQNLKRFWLTQGAHTQADLILDLSGHTIRGQVVGPDGKPLQGVLIASALDMHGRKKERSVGDVECISDQTGHFALEDLGAGRYTLLASHSDYASVILKGVPSGSADVSLALTPASSISGKVVSANDQPIPYFTVALLPGLSSDVSNRERSIKQITDYVSLVNSHYNPDGIFSWEGLTAGKYELVVTTVNGASASQTINLGIGHSLKDLRIKLEPGIRLTGRVVDHVGGKPLPNVEVSITSIGGATMEAVTAKDGKFILDGIPKGEIVDFKLGNFMDTTMTRGTRHLADRQLLALDPSQSNIDLGTFRLLSGIDRERLSQARPSWETIGASFVKLKERFVVSKLDPDGPAAKSGLAQGDVVLSIDSVDTLHLSSNALEYLLSGKSGSPIVLRVERKGGLQQIHSLKRAASPP